MMNRTYTVNLQSKPHEEWHRHNEQS